MNADEYRSMDFYERLGVSRDADVATIEKAYRERVQEYHPDVSDHDDAEELFRLLKEAEETLTDADERAHYDNLGHETYVRRQQAGVDSAYSVDDTSSAAAAGKAGSQTASKQPTGHTRGTSYQHDLEDVEQRHEPAAAYPDGPPLRKGVAYALSAGGPLLALLCFPVGWTAVFGFPGPGGGTGMFLALVAWGLVATLGTIVGSEEILSTSRRIRDF